jgi:hypothetical protein
MHTVRSRLVGALAVTLTSAAIASPPPDALAAATIPANNTRGRLYARAGAPTKVLTTRSSTCPAFLKGHCPPVGTHGKRPRTRTSGRGEHDDRGNDD